MKKIVFISILYLISFNILYANGVVVVNGLTHEHTGIAGNTINGKIKLRNDGSKIEKMILYKEELILKCGQESYFKDTIPHENSLNQWLTTNVSEKQMNATEEYDVVYEAKIPTNLPNGTYYGMIMIENTEPIEENKKEGQVAISSKIRYGISIVIHVGNVEGSTITFEDVNFRKQQSGEYNISALVKNDGKYSINASAVLEIYNNGEKIKTIKQQIGQAGRVYPNKCRRLETVIKDLPQGKYDGILVVDSGFDLFGTNISITID